MRLTHFNTGRFFWLLALGLSACTASPTTSDEPRTAGGSSITHLSQSLVESELTLHSPVPELTAWASSGHGALALGSDIAVVGVPNDALGPGSARGSAIVYKRVDNPSGADAAWQPIQQLVPDTGHDDDRFGYAVAVMDDTILVAAPQADRTLVDQGVIYVFEPREFGWVQTQEIVAASPVTADHLGTTLATHGNTFVAGTAVNPMQVGSGGGQAAQVFERSPDDTFVHVGQLALPTGESTALFADGSARYNAGATSDTWLFTSPEGAYLYDRDGDSFNSSGPYAPTSTANPRHFVKAALAGDRAAIAAQGYVLLLERSGSHWQQDTELSLPTDDDTADDDTAIDALALQDDWLVVSMAGVPYATRHSANGWGSWQALPSTHAKSLALAEDTLWVGEEARSAEETSQVLVYRNDHGSWVQQSRLQDYGVGAAGTFGVAFDLNGTTAAVSAPASSGDSAVYLYRFDDSFQYSNFRWSVRQTITPPEPDPNFGRSIALSSTLLAVGAPSTGSEPGHVYVYERRDGLWVWKAPRLAGLTDEPSFGSTLAVGTNHVLVGTPDEKSCAYLYDTSDSEWPDGACLLPPDAQIDTGFGTSLSVGLDVAAVGAPKFGNAQTPQGAVYLFDLDDPSLDPILLQPQEAREDRRFGTAVSASYGRIAATTLGDPYTRPPQGSVFIFEHASSGWFQRSRIRGTDSPLEAQVENYGRQVSLHANTLVVRSETQASIYARIGNEWSAPLTFDAQNPGIAAGTSLVLVANDGSPYASRPVRAYRLQGVSDSPCAAATDCIDDTWYYCDRNNQLNRPGFSRDDFIPRPLS